MTLREVAARRVEEALLLCTAPRQQVAYDGWLLRPGRNGVSRARDIPLDAAYSVNAYFGSTRPLQEKLRHCEGVCAEHGLPAVFRLTPFSTPANLDSVLEERGYAVYEPTLVQVNRLSALPAPPQGLRFESMLLERWIEEAGELRGHPPELRAAEFERLHNSEVPGYCAIAYLGGQRVACGLVMHEQELAGLFDVEVVEAQRNRGIGTAIAAHLLQTARRMGAEVGWLSVARENGPALRAYAKLGFETLYEYWFRVKPEEY